MGKLITAQALQRTMEKIKQYIDDNSIEIEEDGLTIPGLIDNQYPSLETEDDTLIGAINEVYSIASNNIEGATEEEIQDILNDLFGIEEE